MARRRARATGKRRASVRNFVANSRRVPPLTKAVGLQLDGVGKPPVRREFLGLSREDEDAILDKLDTLISARIR